MIPRPIRKLVIEIVRKHRGGFGATEKRKRAAVKHPEWFLTALLVAINEKLPSITAMLDTRIDEALYRESMLDAKRLLAKRRRVRRPKRKRN